MKRQVYSFCPLSSHIIPCYADSMSILPQVFITFLIFLVILGTLISPELKYYSAQLIALLLLFYIVLKHLGDHARTRELRKARSDEDTLLFLSTYLKPKLEHLMDLTHHEENRDIIQKQLALMKREVERYLEEKEKEVET